MDLTKSQKEYREIVDDVVKRPGNVGYGFAKAEITSDGKLRSLWAKPCTFEQSLVTAFHLEYELFEAISGKQKVDDLPSRRLIEDVTKPHGGLALSGLGRMGLMSVQSAVVLAPPGEEERVLVAKRSDSVSYCPAHWHLIPCGYFEMFEQVHDPATIKENFNPVHAVMREYLEELFDLDDEINAQTRISSYIDEHDLVLRVRDAIDNGDAEFQFLGLVLDLVTLTQKLSFALVVRDRGIIERAEFRANFETKSLQAWSTSHFAERGRNKLWMPESVGLWDLLSRSGLLSVD